MPRGAAAAASSAASSTSPYTAGPGPGFDPNKPPDIAPPQAEEKRSATGGVAVPEELWDEEKLRVWLTNAGDGLHELLGSGDDELWRMTQRDCERIAPPLANVLNRYQPTQAVAQYSDAGAVALGFGIYGWRNALATLALRRQKAEAEAHAGSGVAFAGEHAVPGPIVQPAPPQADANGDGPAVADGYVPFADRLRATRPQPEEESQ